uniref:Peroxisomal membrane protein PEX14 n=1 Tax=Setaria digitata TaxID=48799 RepID=A0A915PM87_9BILA
MIPDKKTAAMEEGSESVPVEMVRPEMVDMARRFMVMPKVRETPLTQQRRFLLQKGLRDDEISEAIKGLQQDMRYSSNTAMGQCAAIPESSINFSTRSSVTDTLLRLTKLAMIITGFSYASWHLLRSYILPRFFNIPEPVEERVRVIETKMDEMQGMMQDVTAELLLKLQTVIDKQNIMDSISSKSGASSSQLEDIQKGIENISAMLVSREQLPAIRTLSRKRSATGVVLGTPRSEEINVPGSPDNVHMEALPTGDSAEVEKSDSGSDY